MKIAPANSTHLSEIFSLLKVVARDLNEKGINQWNENYPTLSHVKTDLNNSSLYCLIKLNKIIGVISADEVQPKEYRAIKWNQTSGKILVIHRLAVHPSFQKMGIGNKLMDFIENRALNKNYNSIRLDAYSENMQTLSFYENRAYQLRGNIFFPYRDLPFHCFEKELNRKRES